MKLYPFLILVFAFFLGQNPAFAQPSKIGGGIDYAKPADYKIAGITVLGAEFTDVQTIKLFAGLQEGDEITVPGEDVSKAIKNLWRQQLFSEVEVYAAEIRGEDIFLVISVKEMPRLSKYGIRGVRKTEKENIKEEVGIIRGMIVNENLITTTKNRVIAYYIDKGFYNAEVDVTTEVDPNYDNSVSLIITINKKERVKIDEITISGADQLKEKQLRRAFKNTKEKRWWRVFKSSKFIEEEYEEDKKRLLAKYNAEGYRNATIEEDSVRRVGEKSVAIGLKVNEGNKFYFRSITFSGNKKYRTGQLDSVLKINRGDVYNVEVLESRLYQNPKGLDISSLYQDDGYLNFQAIPVEVMVENDSIDIEIRILEGKQYRIGNITVIGNTKTNDHVVYREIRTRPGDLFSRTDIIRTQRELANLGYFNPEAFQIIPTQNQAEGTVDIEYIVEEKPSDQIELSGGWGGGRVVGTLGVSFTNFSLRNMFKKGAWRPVPTGDGQRLSIRAQSNGAFFQSYNLSFTEPWLGGKKPNSLSVAVWHSVQSNGQRKKIDGELNPLRQALKITGASVGLGQRWQKPDDWFLMYLGLSYQHFDLNNFNSFFSFANGNSNNLAAEWSLQRNSVSDPIFPTWGSNIKLSVKATLPYSSIFYRDKDFTDVENITEQEKFKWVEYHKWKFTAKWYTALTNSTEENPRKLVLHTNVGLGFLGFYNRDIGLSPFERFYLGGVFLSGFVLDGREIVNLRGYDDLSLTFPNQNTGSPVIAKYGAELRYPLSTNPNATIYALTFAEAGNTWGNIGDFNPFELNRSAGVGLRIFLPMFGLLGLDYGWRFDDIPQAPQMAKGQFHFSIGMNLGEL
jgi:outer membrane protein insertion porin family